MKRIVDQNGKPFKPSLTSEILSLAQTKAMLAEATKESRFVTDLKLRELRASCGVEPEVQTLTFRRCLPWTDK